MIKTLVARGGVERLVCSSGGNAGHAGGGFHFDSGISTELLKCYSLLSRIIPVATAAQSLGLPCDIFVPTTTLPMMRALLERRGARVVVGGANWNEADAEARKLVSAAKVYIPPFDDELIWQGNSTIIDELVEQLPGAAFPDVIVLSVGGGGVRCVPKT